MQATHIENPANPSHNAELTPAGREVRVVHDGEEIARSNDAIIVAEAHGSHRSPKVIYFPAADVSGALEPVDDKSTHCPLKGDASYFTHAGQEVGWTYDRPLPGSEVLRGYVAFYADRVSVEG